MLMEAQLRVRLWLNPSRRASSCAQSPLVCNDIIIALCRAFYGSVVVMIVLILALYVNHKSDGMLDGSL